MSERGSPIRIRAQAMLRDPLTMRFILDAPVQEGGSVRFDGPGDSAPLARALFGVAGVYRVQVEGATILVTRAPRGDWERMKAPIAAAIRTALADSDLPLGDLHVGSQAAQEDDAAMLAAVTRLLDARANPSIASHGGKITAEAVTGGIVHLRMSGGCQGCASSSLTLRRGVETMLRAALPTIRGIVDVTDHSAGTHPFYRDGIGRSPLLAQSVPQGTFTIAAGRIQIAPQFLGHKLGLNAQQVHAGLDTGQITVERLPAAVSGNSLFVVRSPFRSWAAEVAPSGAAHEVAPPASDDETIRQRAQLAAQIRRHFESIGPQQSLQTYGELARAFGLLAPGSIRLVTDALELTMYEDAQAGRPLIAARAVSRATGRPGRGFYELARALDRGPMVDESDVAFHRRCLGDGLGMTITERRT